MVYIYGGGNIFLTSGRFNISKKEKLNSEERKKLLAPDETLRRLGYRGVEVMADIGCGTGLFTFAASDISKGRAEIYAVDLSKEMLEEVQRQIQEKGLSFVETIQSEAYDFKLPSELVDFVLIGFVLHEVEDKKRFLREAVRICKREGKVALIEFKKVASSFGPPLEERLTEKETCSLMESVGLSKLLTMDISDVCYAVVGTK